MDSLEIKDISWYKTKAKEIENNLDNTWGIAYPKAPQGYRIAFLIKEFAKSTPFELSDLFIYND